MNLKIIDMNKVNQYSFPENSQNEKLPNHIERFSVVLHPDVAHHHIYNV